MQVYVLMKSTLITLSCPPLNSTVALPLPNKTLFSLSCLSLCDPLSLTGLLGRLAGWVGLIYWGRVAIPSSYLGSLQDTSRFS